MTVLKCILEVKFPKYTYTLIHLNQVYLGASRGKIAKIKSSFFIFPKNIIFGLIQFYTVIKFFPEFSKKIVL